ncbi:MAG: zinc ribbon domain-containing protein [Ruminococcus sp.]|nr:zinc ribbon domain-containing protein [Ruminococcus sp.]
MSKFCTSCGAQIGDTDMLCPNCGAAQPKISQPVQGYQQPNVQPNPMPNPVYAQINQAQAAENPTGVIGWIGWMLLCSILPLIGAIIMACSAKNKSTKNYAIANLVLMFLGALIFVLIFVVGGVTLSGLLTS